MLVWECYPLELSWLSENHLLQFLMERPCLHIICLTILAMYLESQFALNILPAIEKVCHLEINIDAVDGFHYISSRNIHSSHAHLWILLENFSLLQCSLTINSNDISTLHRTKLFCVPWCHLVQSCNFVARSNVRFSVFNTFYRIYVSIKPQTN